MNKGIIIIDLNVHYGYICIVNKHPNLYNYEFCTKIKKGKNGQGVVPDRAR